MEQGQVSKIFNDPIHGSIELHPLCVKIVDTPQFQRLRFIKQLGGCYFVFPGASHNRFEHSLGVCHLAGQFARVLQRRQSELDISNEDVLCVEIAGLCHDLGHGPFSHVFDGQIFPRIGKGKPWKHEEGSISMFNHLVKENKLGKAFEKADLNDTDQVFITELINPPKEDKDRKGRGKEKWFLYEIVANKRNGIDVDKWDYFARDCHMLGIRNNFDHDRLMKFSRVIEVDDVPQICFKYKEAFNLYEMFHTRSALHRRAYQHKVNKIIEAMITDAIVKANDHIKIQGRNGEVRTMSECVDDMVAYTNLTDEIIQQILLSTDKALQPSKDIINKVFFRKLYKFIGQTRPKSAEVMNKEDIDTTKKKVVEYLSYEGGPNKDDIHVYVVSLDYGKGGQNPLTNVRFYGNRIPDVAFEVPKSQVSRMLPEIFAEQIFRVYCKTEELADSGKKKLEEKFTRWCKENDMDDPELSERE